MASAVDTASARSPTPCGWPDHALRTGSHTTRITWASGAMPTCCPMLACGDRLSPNVVFQSAVEIRTSWHRSALALAWRRCSHDCALSASCRGGRSRTPETSSHQSERASARAVDEPLPSLGLALEHGTGIRVHIEDLVHRVRVDAARLFFDSALPTAGAQPIRIIRLLFAAPPCAPHHLAWPCSRLATDVPSQTKLSFSGK